MDYSRNTKYWSGNYDAPNVESFIFRFYGRILKFDFGIKGNKDQKVFDFGCGEGGALNFFHNQGFSVYGVDIAEQDLLRAKNRFAEKETSVQSGLYHFEQIDPKPNANQRYFEDLNLPDNWIDVAISIQTLDFLSDTDCQIVLRNIYDQMKPGAVIYASFNGTQNYYNQHSTDLPGGDGLREVKFNNGRVNYDLLLNFCPSKDAMREKFSIFQPKYLDYYDSSFREEGSEFRWTFCGTKPLS